MRTISDRLGRASLARASVSELEPVGIPDPSPVEFHRLADSFCAMDPTIALRWARATFLSDIRQEMTELTVPCLVMQSRDDKLAPEAVGHWLAANLPTSRLEMLQAIGARSVSSIFIASEVATVLQSQLAWRG